MKKRASISPIGIALIELVIAVLIILALIKLVPILYLAIFAPEQICDNSAEWSNVVKTIREIESGKESAEINFYNKNCKLVSFTSEPVWKIVPKDVMLKDKPQLCIGLVDNSEFTKYKCYTLQDFDTINSEQFSTADYADYIFLEFHKDGKTLRITPKGATTEQQNTFTAEIKNSVPQIESAYLTFSASQNLERANIIAELNPSEIKFPISVYDFASHPEFYFTLKLFQNSKEIDYSKITGFSLQLQLNSVYSSSISPNAEIYLYGKLPTSIDITKFNKNEQNLYDMPKKSQFINNWALNYKNI